MNVTGLKIEDITSMSIEDITSLNEQDLRQITGRLVSAGNKRLRRAKPTESGIFSPAVMSLAQQQGIDLEKGLKPQFSINREMTRNQVLAKFTQIKNFLTSKTSTARGFKEYRKEVVKVLGKGITSTKERENNFWRAYNRFMVEEHNQYIFKSKGEQGVLTWLVSYVDKTGVYDTDKLHQALKNEMERSGFENEEIDDEEFEGFSIRPDEINPRTV